MSGALALATNLSGSEFCAFAIIFYCSRRQGMSKKSGLRSLKLCVAAPKALSVSPGLRRIRNLSGRGGDWLVGESRGLVPSSGLVSEGRVMVR